MVYLISVVIAIFLTPFLHKKIFSDFASSYTLSEKMESILFVFFLILIAFVILCLIVGALVVVDINPISYIYETVTLIDIDVTTHSSTIIDENELSNIDISSVEFTNESEPYIIRKIKVLPELVKTLFLFNDHVEYIYYYPYQ